MKVLSTNFPGLFVIELFKFQDERGEFVKVFSEKTFVASKLNANFKEFFFSISRKDVIRGMHFQLPPFAHEKIVFVISGAILDVVVDLRKNTKTYGKVFSKILSAENRNAIYIPKGMAHGFKALENNSIVGYFTTTEYSKEHDTGIRWDSINFDWQCNNPIISERDKSFIRLEDFKTPF